MLDTHTIISYYHDLRANNGCKESKEFNEPADKTDIDLNLVKK